MLLSSLACQQHGITTQKKFAALFAKVVIYGDCGVSDAFLDEQNCPHCYHSFMGDAGFDAAMDQELGTFFLTDYMVRHFERIVMKGMGLRDHPQLRDIYFAHYKRVLYIAQTDDAALIEKARRAAATLQLEYDYHYTGFADYTDFFTICATRQPNTWLIGLLTNAI